MCDVKKILATETKMTKRMLCPNQTHETKVTKNGITSIEVIKGIHEHTCGLIDSREGEYALFKCNDCGELAIVIKYGITPEKRRPILLADAVKVLAKKPQNNEQKTEVFKRVLEKVFSFFGCEHWNPNRGKLCGCFKVQQYF